MRIINGETWRCKCAWSSCYIFRNLEISWVRAMLLVSNQIWLGNFKTNFPELVKKNVGQSAAQSVESSHPACWKCSSHQCIFRLPRAAVAHKSWTKSSIYCNAYMCYWDISGLKNNAGRNWTKRFSGGTYKVWLNNRISFIFQHVSCSPVLSCVTAFASQNSQTKDLYGFMMLL